MAIMGKDSYAGAGYVGYYLQYNPNSDNCLRFTTRNSGTLPGCYLDGTVPVAITDGWTHVCAVRESNVLSLYIDGVLDGSVAEPEASTPINVSNAVYFKLARADEIGSMASFNGNLDDARVYAHALTVPEIVALAAM